MLRVDGNGMGDEGLRLLSNGLSKNSTLFTLDVSNNGLTDVVVDVLCQCVVKCTSLVNLYFAGNKFSQEKGDMLEKLVKMKK